MTDTEIVDWLSAQCFFPDDHPHDQLIVIVPEKFAASGAFTMNPENDKQALRKAVEKAASPYP